MATQINIPGFALDINDGRAWNSDFTLGLALNDDGTLSLLDSDAYPANHTLAPDHAEHILRVAAVCGDDADGTMRRWDCYASAV